MLSQAGVQPERPSIFILNNMKLIPLTQGQFAQVDDEDYDYLMQFKWYARKGKNTYYVVRNSERDLDYKQHTLFMHRIILNVTDPNVKIDHKDRNGLNCQKGNIRTATSSQNGANRTPYGKSKYLGVYLVHPNAKNRRKTIAYRIEIKHIDKKIQKQFKTEEQAALAYNELALKYHGEFANLNIISD